MTRTSTHRPGGTSRITECVGAGANGSSVYPSIGIGGCSGAVPPRGMHGDGATAQALDLMCLHGRSVLTQLIIVITLTTIIITTIVIIIIAVIITITPHTCRGPRAPPKAPVLPPACVPYTLFGTPLTRFVAPGSSTEGPSAAARMRPPTPTPISAQLHRRSQWGRPHASPTPNSAHPEPSCRRKPNCKPGFPNQCLLSGLGPRSPISACLRLFFTTLLRMQQQSTSACVRLPSTQSVIATKCGRLASAKHGRPRCNAYGRLASAEPDQHNHEQPRMVYGTLASAENDI